MKGHGQSSKRQGKRPWIKDQALLLLGFPYVCRYVLLRLDKNTIVMVFSLD